MIAKLPKEKIPNLAMVFPRHIIEEGYGVGIDVSTVAVSYNTRDVQKPPQTLVHGAPNPELGAEFINEVLDAEMQATLTKKLSNASVVHGLQLPPETLARMPNAESQERVLFVCDWEFINTIRAEWTERWNRVFS